MKHRAEKHNGDSDVSRSNQVQTQNVHALRILTESLAHANSKRVSPYFTSHNETYSCKFLPCST